MEFFATVEKRRSVRVFTDQQVSDEIIQKALAAAVRAPNSSNTQTWDFYWVKDTDKKQKLVKYCMGQSAARTANQLIVVTADPKKWHRSVPAIVKYLDQVKAPQQAYLYYQKLVPIFYRWGFLNSLAPLKWLAGFLPGLFRPMPRGSGTLGGLQTVATKSAALACENLMLALTAQGCASCPMEGFDENRVRRLLKLPSSAVVCMVIGIGYESEKGIWGEQFRLPIEDVVHVV